MWVTLFKHRKNFTLGRKMVYIGVAHALFVLFSVCIYRSHSIRYLPTTRSHRLYTTLPHFHTRVCRPTTTKKIIKNKISIFSKLFLPCPDSLVAVLRSSSHSYFLFAVVDKSKIIMRIRRPSNKPCFCFLEKPITSVIVLSL